MAADEKVLGALHTAVAVALAEALKGQEIPGEEDEETGEVKVHVIPPSAAIIQAAAKFLKDNNITCVPSKDNALGALEQAVKDRAAKRAERKATLLDKATAKDDMDFMQGLPN